MLRERFEAEKRHPHEYIDHEDRIAALLTKHDQRIMCAIGAFAIALIVAGITAWSITS